jgi:polyphosphate glucokinase
VVAEVARFFEWTGPTGATFPAIIKGGIAYSAANVDPSWIGTNAAQLFTEAFGGDVTVINDADAAGIAELTFGAGKDHGGVVIMITLGTGIGSALFVDGTLVPNTELGHLRMGKKDAEGLASDSVREDENLSWREWSSRLEEYFQMVEALFSPDLFIVGGGISKKADKFLPRLDLHAEIGPRSAERGRDHRRRASHAPRRRAGVPRLTPAPSGGVAIGVARRRVGRPPLVASRRRASTAGGLAWRAMQSMNPRLIAG